MDTNLDSVMALHNNPIRFSNGAGIKTDSPIKQFEALFISFMVKAMHTSTQIFSQKPTPISESIFTDLLDTEYSKLMAQNNTFNLSHLIQDTIDTHENNQTVTDALYNTLYQHSYNENTIIPETQAPASFLSQNSKEAVDQWNTYIEEACQLYNVDSALIRAVISQESAGNQFAVSPKGAKGLMQIMDTTAQELGITNVFNARENILGGTSYLKQLLRQFDNNETLALASYNAGPGNVLKYKGIPPFKETQNYVVSVLQKKTQFQYELEDKIKPEN